jgi:hypothetical protein
MRVGVMREKMGVFKSLAPSGGGTLRRGGALERTITNQHSRSEGVANGVPEGTSKLFVAEGFEPSVAQHEKIFTPRTSITAE